MGRIGQFLFFFSQTWAHPSKQAGPKAQEGFCSSALPTFLSHSQFWEKATSLPFPWIVLQQQGLRMPRNTFWKADGFAAPGRVEGGMEAAPSSTSAWRQPCRTGASEELYFCFSSGCWVLKASKVIALCCTESSGGMLGSLERKKRTQGTREAAVENWLYGSAWHVISVWIPKLNHFSFCTVRIWGRIRL